MIKEFNDLLVVKSFLAFHAFHGDQIVLHINAKLIERKVDFNTEVLP